MARLGRTGSVGIARCPIVAVDGPRQLRARGPNLAAASRRHFGLPVLDTGLLYRAVGQQHAGPKALDLDARRSWRSGSALRLRCGMARGRPADGMRAAGEAASRVAPLTGLRAALRRFQQDFAAPAGRCRARRAGYRHR